MTTPDQLGEEIASAVRKLPEYRMGAHRVVLIMNDGTRVDDVHIAWGDQVVRVGDLDRCPVDLTRVVAVENFDT